MAEHESQAIFKIVIPYEEYQRLKTIEVQFHNLQKQFVLLQSEKKREKINDDKESEKTAESVSSLTGGGEIVNEDSTYTIPHLLEIQSQEPELSQPNIVINKNDESDNCEDNLLLSTVPKAHLKKAHTLLEILNERSAELTWNKEGTILIDQIAIPHTNIFKIFRFLFIRNKPVDCNGFLELHDKLESMGLSSLINIRHRIRQKNVILNVTKKDASFWYLG